MPLEDELRTCTAALSRVADLLEKSPVAPAATTTAEPAKRPPGRPAKKVVTLDEAKVVATKVVKEKGQPVYLKLLQGLGADRIASLPEAKYAEFIAAAEVLLSEKPAEAEAYPEDDGL